MEKSGFFRQHLITSIRRQRLNFRNVHQDLTAVLSSCFSHKALRAYSSEAVVEFGAAPVTQAGLLVVTGLATAPAGLPKRHPG